MKVYIGRKERTEQGNTNLGSEWVEGPDGLFFDRKGTKKHKISKYDIKSDVANNYLEEINEDE